MNVGVCERVNIPPPTFLPLPARASRRYAPRDRIPSSPLALPGTNHFYARNNAGDRRLRGCFDFHSQRFRISAEELDVMYRHAKHPNRVPIKRQQLSRKNYAKLG